jgi:hypothetical protein
LKAKTTKIYRSHEVSKALSTHPLHDVSKIKARSHESSEAHNLVFITSKIQTSGA